MAIDSTSTGDARLHRTLDELEQAFAALPPAPRDDGRVVLIVSKARGGVRNRLEVATLSRDGGVPGDAWRRGRHPDPLAQITVMQEGVASLIANGQPLDLFGDNLIVDLDLSAANLPAGSRVQMGGAILEVTPEPHNGCVKFQTRFGSDALRFVSRREQRHLNLRGIYMRVVSDGDVRPGDAVRVLSR
jgi:MOSC domain-containing protein YiiM